MKKRIGVYRWGLLAGLGLAVSVVADEDPHPLPDMRVFPDRQLLRQPTLESPALDGSVAEMSAEDVAVLQPATAGHALAFAPGIHTETRGRKYKQMYSFRGQVYPYPDISFNGLWHREAREVPYVYPGAALERIVLNRSTSMLLLGLADVVGVIDIQTRRPSLDPDDPLQHQIGVEGGSYGVWRGYGFTEARSDAVAGRAGMQYYRYDGRSGRNAAEELSSAFGTVVYAPSERTRVEGDAYVLHGYRELEMPDPDGPATQGLKNRRERYDPLTYAHLSLRGYHRTGAAASTYWSLYLTDRQARYKREVINPERAPFRAATADEDDREYAAQVIQALRLTDDNTLRLGLYAHRWTAPNGKQSYVGARQDVSSFAVVLTDEQRVGAWTFDGGVRIARSYLHDYSGPAFDVAGVSTQTESVRNEWDDPVLSGTLGATVDLNDRNRLYWHGAIGERKAGPGAIRADGTRPDTEHRMTTETGWSSVWGRNADGAWKLGGFWVERRDAVTRTRETGIDARGSEFYFADNQDIRQAGIEVEVETPAFAHDRLQLISGVTWMTSAARDVDGSFRTYKEVPSLIASLGIRANAGDWDAGLFAKQVNSFENSRFAQGGVTQDLGDYVDVSLVVGWRVGIRRTIRLYAAVDNVLDDEYSTVVGWSDPGIRYRFGAEAAF